MQVAMFLFIKRKWSDDQKALCKLLSYFADIEHKIQVNTRQLYVALVENSGSVIKVVFALHAATRVSGGN